MEFNDIKKEDCCLHSSFPEVKKNIKYNEKFAKKLIDIYAGSKSEFTAICQYIYQSFIVKPQFKELSEILENISICEMQHQEIISQILLSMRINPKFCKYIDSNLNICNYWSAGNVKYITDIPKFIDYNIKNEEYAINDYKELIKLTDNQNIIDIITTIIKDEEAHINIFHKIKSKFKNNNRSLDNNKENEEENIDNIDCNREIVSIFSNSKVTSTPKKETNDNIITEIKDKENDIIQNNNIVKNDTIQIPITDLNNLSDEDLIYYRLKEKTYEPDEIIDG